MKCSVQVLSSVAVAALLNLSQPNLAIAQSLPEKEPSPVQKIFVPEGFDDNDNVEVVVHGHFPNSCMKIGPVEFDINPDSRVISLRPEVYVYQAPYCLPVEIPFVQKVALGNLAEGIWKVEAERFPDIHPLPLVIGKARSAAPDEALYAPVDDVLLMPEPQSQHHRVVVSGRWPQVPEGKCFELVNVSSKLGRDNVLVVLPIAEMKNEGQCQSSVSNKRAFVGGGALNQVISGDVLVHVRVLNGESLNKLHEIHH